MATVGRTTISLLSVPSLGWVCTAIRCSGTYDWISLNVPDLEELTVKKIKVGEVMGGSATNHLAPVETDTFSRLMSLVSHTACTRYDDGEVRTTGWFTIKTVGSSWCVQVKDPDACASLQAIGATLDDALALAELLLSSEQAPWEHDRYLAAQRKEKKK